MKTKSVIIFSLILLLAGLFRFYQLGQNPPALDWDEASLGWNAWSILKTGTDEYGYSHPVAIRSFNDYKPPLYAYTLVPVMAIFGKTDFAVRLPSAIFGTLVVVLLYFLSDSLFKNQRWRGKTALLVMLFAAVNPWLIQFSRIAFEANMALGYFLAGAWLVWIYFWRRGKLWHLLLATVFLTLSIYAYHSSRILVPLLMLVVVITRPKKSLADWKNLLLAGLLTAVLLFPIARNAVRVGGLQARFDTVSIFKDQPQPEIPTWPEKILNSPPVYYSGLIAKNFFSHFDFNFLFINADNNLRHHAPGVGLLLLFDFPLLLYGAFQLAKNRPPWLSFLLIWLTSAPIASTITTSAPHAIRGLALAPALLIVSGYGMVSIWETFNKQRSFLQIAIPTLFSIALMCNVFYFAHMYFIHLPIEFAAGWQYGYRQMVAKVLARENQYDHLVITTAYDQPYIYFLFYGRIDPIIKNDGYFYQTLDKYSFGDPGSYDYLKKIYPRILYVLSPKDSQNGFEIIDTVKYPDGSVAFELAQKL